jgi:SAM-dependent methyltransferase
MAGALSKRGPSRAPHSTRQPATRQPATRQRRPTGDLVLRNDDGQLLPLQPSRWHGPLTAADRRMLEGLVGPVLDVGCGPGRIVEGLARRGVVVLGVDSAPGAVAMTRGRGCAAVQRSVFERLPGEGRWASVLLLDGNVGIGGDPIRLLRRCRSLMTPTGVVVAEVERPGAGWRTCRARLERAEETGPWFDWSVVGADAIAGLARAAGLALRSVQGLADDRWFAQLAVGAATDRACA